MHFLNVHIMNVDYAKFQKKRLIVEQFQGNHFKRINFNFPLFGHPSLRKDLLLDTLGYSNIWCLNSFSRFAQFDPVW